MTTALQQQAPAQVAPLRQLKQSIDTAIDSDYGQATVKVITQVCESPTLVSAVNKVLAAAEYSKHQLLPQQYEKSLDAAAWSAYSFVDGENIDETLNNVIDVIDEKIDETLSKTIGEENKTKIVDATEQAKTKFVDATQQAKTTIVDATEQAKTTIVDATEQAKTKIVDAREQAKTKIAGARTQIDESTTKITDKLCKSLVAIDQNEYVNRVASMLEPAVDSVVDYVLPEEEGDEVEEAEQELRKHGLGHHGGKKGKKGGKVKKAATNQPQTKGLLELVAGADKNDEFVVKKAMRLTSKVTRRVRRRCLDNTAVQRVMATEQYKYLVATLQIGILHRLANEYAAMRKVIANKNAEFVVYSQAQYHTHLQAPIDTAKGRVLGTYTLFTSRLVDFGTGQVDKYAPTVAPIVAPFITPVAPYVVSVATMIAGMFGFGTMFEKQLCDAQKHPTWRKVLKYTEAAAAAEKSHKDQELNRTVVAPANSPVVVKVKLEEANVESGKETKIRSVKNHHD